MTRTTAQTNISISGKRPLISLRTKAKKNTSMSSSSNLLRRQQRAPVDVLRSILHANDCLPIKKASITFQKPEEKNIDAYDIESVRAIRSNDMERLRQLWTEGRCLDACNQFGESLLHMACRRGNLTIVSFLVCEVKVRTDRCDDFGRNAFHDALWTSTPNYDVVDLLIENADPSLLLAEDVRGNTPFAYARREHDAGWVSFLEQRREKLAAAVAKQQQEVGLP